MDQLKVALAWIKQHHFWLLSLLVVALTLGAWSMGQSRLATETAANKGAIEREFNSVQGIRRQPFHPNPRVNSAQAEETRQLAAKVRQEWQRLYEVQVNEVLKWPPQLGQDFQTQISKLSFGEDIPIHLRNEYLNYIQGRFPDLPKIVDAAVSEGDGGGRGRRGGGFELEAGRGGRDTTDEAVEDHMVVWHDQDRIRQQLDWQRRPSSTDIWVTQEDLWVYETLLRAIAATNEEAKSDRYGNAAVRDILQLEVGAAATMGSAGANRIYTPESGETGVGGRGGSMMSEGLSAGGRGSTGGGRGGADEEGASPLSGRYLDDTGQPMPAPPPGSPPSFGTEYKRLPVRLVMRLDQRWLQFLMAQLANAPLQVEIQEVRINPTQDAGAGGSFGRKRGSGENMAFNREPYVRDRVVIDGLVYLFYPPDEQLLEVPTGDAGLAAN